MTEQPASTPPGGEPSPGAQENGAAHSSGIDLSSVWTRVPGQIFIVVAAVLVVVAVLAFSRLKVPESESGARQALTQLAQPDWVWLTVAVVLAVAAVMLLLSGARRLGAGSSPDKGSFRATVMSAALANIGIGAVVMIGIIVLVSEVGPEAKPIDWSQYMWNELAVAAGIVIAILSAVIFGVVQRERILPSRVNPWQYGQLAERRDSLQARYDHVCTKDPQIPRCREAQAHLDQVSFALAESSAAPASSDGRNGKSAGAGDKWVMGTGFVEMWERIHAGEAVLHPLLPTEEVLTSGLYDELRLIDSAMPNEDELLKRLRRAVIMLGGRDYLQDGSGFTDLKVDPNNATAEAEAKHILASVRRTIDGFRDQSRSGLVRTRLQLMGTGLVTSIVAIALLILALLGGIGREQLIAGVTFFLVAAVVGLLSQLRTLDTDVRTGEDDFGLDEARMVYTPVIAGLAGLGGVLLMAMFFPTLNVALTPRMVDSAQIQVPELYQIFSLQYNRFGVIVAAVFGLTPGLLIDRLRVEADRYKAELQSTSAQSRKTPETGKGTGQAKKESKPGVDQFPPSPAAAHHNT